MDLLFQRKCQSAATLDEKVIDFGSSQPLGILEVKCPSIKSAVTPLDACADPNFFVSEWVTTVV